MRIPMVYGPGVRVGARGSNLIAVQGGLGKPVLLPYAKTQMACLAHVDDIAEVIVRLLMMADKPKHEVYQIGGHTISYEEMANIGKELIPDMQISFKEGHMRKGYYFIDSSRMTTDVGVEHRPLKEGYLELLNLTRKEAGWPPLT